MDLVVSPYHLTTREVPAMAAMLLASRVCTLLPVPLRGGDGLPGSGETREALAAALSHSPRYLRLLRSWLVFGPLFEAGVIESLREGHDPIADVRASAARLEEEEAWSPLQRFSRAEMFDDADDYLDGFSADLIKGGPDPGISVPTSAGLDHFAASRGMMVCRSGPPQPTAREARMQVVPEGSLAQQAESRLGEPVFSVGLPVLTQASAKVILHVRALLRPQLDALRAAMTAAVKNPGPAQTPAVRRAGAAYAAAFNAELFEKLGRDDESGRRIVQGYAALTCRRLPADATLICALAAFNRATGARAAAVAAAPGTLHTLTVTPMNVAMV